MDYWHFSLVVMLVTLVFLLLTMTLLGVVGLIIVFHKIHLLAAGVVLIAMLAPFFGVAWWYVHINRLLHHYGWLRDDYSLGNDHGLRINNRWRRPRTYLYPAVHAGLDDSTNAHIDIGLGLCCGTYPTTHSYSGGQTNFLQVMHMYTFQYKTTLH
jgi:cytochrome c biogenesis protein CcdA